MKKVGCPPQVSAPLGVAPEANWRQRGPTGVSPVGGPDDADGQDARRPSLYWQKMTEDNA